MGPVPAHDRAGDQVAQPLAAGVERHEQQAGQVGRGQEVGEPEQVAHGGGADRDRVAGVHHHPDADHPLARRLAPAEPFEEDEIAGPRHERADREQHRRHKAQPHAEAREDSENNQRGERPAHQDGHVDHRRQRAGPDAGDLEVEHDVLGGLDLEVLAVVRRRVAQGGHAAIVISLRP